MIRRAASTAITAIVGVGMWRGGTDAMETKMRNFKLIVGGVVALLLVLQWAPARADVLTLGDVDLGTSDVIVGGFDPGASTGTLVVDGGSSLTKDEYIIGGGANAVGTLLVDGLESLATVNGNFDATSAIQVGHEGHGSLVIQNGGTVTVGDGSTFIGSHIANAAGSTGAVTVKGEGSAFNVNGDLTLGDGALFTLAEDGLDFGISGAPAIGVLGVFDGGDVIANGLTLGFRENGSGEVHIAGTGSTIESSPDLGDSFYQIGRSGHGILNITNGGVVSGLNGANIGRNTNSGGVVNISGAGSVLGFEGIDSGGFGPFLTIGRNGSGTLNVFDGGQLVFDPMGVISGPCCGSGFNVARNPEGVGNVTARGADSEIRVKGGFGFVGVGRRGTGELTVATGANLMVEDGVGGSIFVAPANRSVGTLRVLGETKDQSGVPTGTVPTSVDAGGFLGLGVAFDQVSSAGVATLIVDSGGTVTADTVEIGPNGTVFSNGTINATTINNSGVINPGFSPGIATFGGILVIKPGGVLKIEVFGDQVGEFDVVNATSIVFEEGSQLKLVIDETVEGEVVVLNANEVDGTATVTTTVVDESGDTVSTTETEAILGAGGSELSLDISEGGETEIVSSGAAIDVKPSDPENLINTRSNAVIPVALLADVRPSEVTAAFFGPYAAIAEGLSREDVDGDGSQDLVARFRLRKTGITVQSLDACLTIQTVNGQTFEGCDAITVVK